MDSKQSCMENCGASIQGLLKYLTKKWNREHCVYPFREIITLCQCKGKAPQRQAHKLKRTKPSVCKASQSLLALPFAQ